MRALIFVIKVISLVFLLSSCTVLNNRPVFVQSTHRLDLFPTSGLPVEKPISIYWNDFRVPFIEAQSDRDAAFALGMVQAHLRLGQIEIFRMVSEARLSEMAGPFATDIDRALRTINFSKSVDEQIRTMDKKTRVWIEAFVDGINAYKSRDRKRPIEMEVLNIPDRPWTVVDVLRVGRLASVDITWAFYLKFFQFKQKKGWEKAFKRYLEIGKNSTPSFSNDSLLSLESLIMGFSKSGSNSLAVSKKRAKGSSAFMANDPHLGIFAPNIWLLVGIKSPSYHMVGLMLPCLPFIGVGRNRDIAWGGTNMRTISTHLFELTKEDLKDVTTRKEKIKVRWWFDEEIEVRDSKYGPIISDVPLFKSEKPIAFNWLGHQATHELSAFLKANRSKNFKQFRSSFEEYGVSAQNMLYADSKGNIGHVLAYRQPLLKNNDKQLKLVKPSSEFTGRYRKSTELPHAYNPQSGFIASANNKPTEDKIPFAYTYSNNDRVERLQELMDQAGRVGLKELKGFQQDVFSKSSFRIKEELVRRVGENIQVSDKAAGFWQAFRMWDGHYLKESRGAVAFEILSFHLVDSILLESLESEELKNFYKGSDYWKPIVLEELKKIEPQLVKDKIVSALESGAEQFKKYKSWGEMHKQIFQHPLGFVPVVGERYQLQEYETSGGNDTLLKAAHRFSEEETNVTYGANARHISDMSDLNENYFVLLGGQDGWLKNPHLDDQVDLWRKGQYMRIPLEIDRVKKGFKDHLLLKN